MGESGLPSVSLIIPTFNMAAFLGDALDSALGQTVPFSQIIVVDDGSTDATEAALERFAGRIQVVRQANKGVSVARNVGLEHATGDLVAFLDADDVVLPDRLARQLVLFQDHPETQFSDGWSSYFWCPGLSPSERQSDHRHAHDFWRQRHAGHISTWLVRRAAFDHVGLFEPGLAYSEDTDWRLRGVAKGLRSRRLDSRISCRRLHRTNVTRTKGQEQASRLMQVIRRHRERVEGLQE